MNEHTHEQGLRVHHLVNLGGLVAVAGLDREPPDFLLGVLVSAAHEAAALTGFAGAGKSATIAAARDAWQAEGYRVLGGALSGIAAENLERAAGVQSRTLAAWEQAWRAGRSGFPRATF